MPDPPTVASGTAHVIAPGVVVANERICNEHYRITFRVEAFPEAFPGQFVHIGPQREPLIDTDRSRGVRSESAAGWLPGSTEPFLRRAFSIAGLRRGDGGVEIDVIHRVVGTLTRWLAGLSPGDHASLLGPQGNRFPIDAARPAAWLVAGGVGLPPLLWLAEALRAHGRRVVFFYGAQRADLVALRMDPGSPPAADACAAALASKELAPLEVPVVLSTDDGSLGFRGHVGQALEAYHRACPVPPDQLVLYTCGPERMMAFVADFAGKIGVPCFACVERSMACATGMCQSCVVPLRDEADSEGWRYRLCCTDGPVFDAGDVIWDFEAFSQARSDAR